MSYIRINIASHQANAKNVKMIKLFHQSNGIFVLIVVEDSPECDDQFSIQLPKYQHYDIYSNLLKNIIDGKNHYTDDIDDLSVYNLVETQKTSRY